VIHIAPSAPTRLLIFDFDGTVADCFGDIHAAVDHAMRAMGLPRHDLATVRKWVGNGARVLAQQAIGPTNLDRTDEALGLFAEWYLAHPADHARVYPGVAELLRAARTAGWRTAIVSNKPHPITVQVVELLGLAPLFDVVLGEQPPIERKPAPDMLLEACRRVGASPAQAIMIGDGPMDAEAARRAGTRMIGVLWGMSTPEEICATGGPECPLAADAPELRTLIGL